MNHEPDAEEILRQRAEAEALNQRTQALAARSSSEVQLVLHELSVHQIELRMQNEELLRAQGELLKSQAQHADVYEFAPIAFLTLDAEDVVLQANARAGTMLGVLRDDLVGKPLARFIEPEDQDTYYLHRRALRASALPQTCDLRMQPNVGTEVWARLHATSANVEGYDGPVRLTAITDVTESHNIKTNLARSEIMVSLGMLAAGVAHEINNPLTYVLFNLDSLAEALPDLAAELTRCVAQIRDRHGDKLADEIVRDHEALEPSRIAEMGQQASEAAVGGRRIAEMVKRLSLHTRVPQGRRSTVDVNAALAEALGMVTQEITPRARLQRDFGTLPPVHARSGELVQVFVNLLVNATHAIKLGAAEDNLITVRSWTLSQEVFVEISDTGSGIEEGVLPHIFEPFYTTKGREYGSGLGLAITRRIVTDCEGDIQVASTVGTGSRFVVRLPVAPDAPTMTVTMDVVADAEPAKVRGRVLIVDDDKFVRSVTARILSKEHDVVQAESGQKAITELTSDNNFDFIICDLMMGDVSGVEFHEWLVTHEPRLADALAFLTGGVFTSNVTTYLRDIPNLCLEKPIDAHTLRKVVREGLSRDRD